jgi:DNA adenine methylase
MKKIDHSRDKELRPFVKWAGGKSQLLNQFEALYPQKFSTYFEPFLGGGAVFFDLYRKKRISRAILTDSNKDLMNLWSAVKNVVGDLIAELEVLQTHVAHRVKYYERRKEFNSIELDKDFRVRQHIRKAALMLYLNKTCYNGLYRVNAHGQFNVPLGRYKNPKLYQRANLSAVHEALNHDEKVQLRCVGFEICAKEAKKGDFVYFDPPYQPVSKTSSFTSYTAGGFGEVEQNTLARVFRELDSNGCYVMQSNSYSEDFLQKLYSEYFPDFVHKVKAPRAISSVGSGRGPIQEFVILNYRAKRTQLV